MDTNFIVFENFEMLLRILILFVELVYAAYAFILVRQVKLMNASFSTIMKPVFMFLARIHMVAALLIVIISILLLL